MSSASGPEEVDVEGLEEQGGYGSPTVEQETAPPQKDPGQQGEVSDAEGDETPADESDAG
ncbi:hypothetical protein [Sinomonas albida]|uniref:hypothetical protein n=1 Tax=Sinomonas albida TaxID=369942 RepID=UPI0010A81B11|nr:hypothetical protein [Sinomonas albida]